MNSNSSTRRGFTLVEIMVVVVVIGMLAALAVPTFQLARRASQDKTILNNIRQLSGAADHYFLEFGTSTVAITSLVGSSAYINALNTVANETYPDTFTLAVPITVSNIAGTRTITYEQ